MEASTTEKLSKKEKWDIFFGFIQFGLILLTVFLAYKAYQQTNNIFKSQSLPNIIITENNIDSTFQLMLWNMGPGVAYDISVETHFTYNSGHVGVLWVKEVIESAIEIETKKEVEINYNYNTTLLGTKNPPTTLPVGLDYSYKIKPNFHPVLSGLIIIIRYKDNIGDLHSSYWNGFNWSHSSGVFKTPSPDYPDLNPSNPVDFFIEMLNIYEIENYRDYQKLYNRIMKEAKYLEENGYKISSN